MDDTTTVVKELTKYWTVHDLCKAICHLCCTMNPFDYDTFLQPIFDNEIQALYDILGTAEQWSFEGGHTNFCSLPLRMPWDIVEGTSVDPSNDGRDCIANPIEVLTSSTHRGRHSKHKLPKPKCSGLHEQSSWNTKRWDLRHLIATLLWFQMSSGSNNPFEIVHYFVSQMKHRKWQESNCTQRYGFNLDTSILEHLGILQQLVCIE